MNPPLLLVDVEGNVPGIHCGALVRVIEPKQEVDDQIGAARDGQDPEVEGKHVLELSQDPGVVDLVQLYLLQIIEGSVICA